MALSGVPRIKKRLLDNTIYKADSLVIWACTLGYQLMIVLKKLYFLTCTSGLHHPTGEQTVAVVEKQYVQQSAPQDWAEVEQEAEI